MTGVKLSGGVELRPSVFKKVVSYVPQEDVYHPTQTVLDAVMFQSQLRYYYYYYCYYYYYYHHQRRW